MQGFLKEGAPARADAFAAEADGLEALRPHIRVPRVLERGWKDGRAYDPKKGWHIVGYTTRDGLYHKYSGLARLDPTDDQVHFTPIQTSRSAEKVEAKPLVIPRERIRALEIEELTDVGQFGKVVAIALGAVLVVGLIALIYVGATMEESSNQGGSCPFLYAFDGERFFLEGEPYGGAIAPSLERDDWCELSTLQPLAGRYHLLLRNPADETDRTNSLQLLVADHEPGSRVVRDGLGGMHAFRRTAPLTRATDSQGRDVSRPLRAADRDEWFSDLDAIADGQEPAVLREPIEIEFARPLGADSVWLLGRVRSTPWSGRPGSPGSRTTPMPSSWAGET